MLTLPFRHERLFLHRRTGGSSIGFGHHGVTRRLALFLGEAGRGQGGQQQCSHKFHRQPLFAIHDVQQQKNGRIVKRA